MRAFIIAFLLGVSTLAAQTKTFDIFVMGNDVGDLTVTRTINGTKKTYKVESNTEVDYLIDSRSDHFTCLSEFENGVLASSKVEDLKNKKLDFYTYVSKVGTGYKIQTESGLSTIAGAIKSSLYDAYFKEPADGESFFSERYGKFGTMVRSNDHVYKFTMKGNENVIYTYENGALHKTELSTIVGKVKMIAK